MEQNLNSVEAVVRYDNLVITAGDAGTIEIASGEGKLTRGSVIDNAGKLLATGATPYGILTDDVDATSEAVVATVWKSGKFVKNSLVTKGDIDASDIDALRVHGIFVEEALV